MFDQSTLITLPLGLAIALVATMALASATGPVVRRYKRRLRDIGGRKRGIVATGGPAARSLSRRESATPTMDRIVRRWLPNRLVLAQRLARTGRNITIGQYGLATLGLFVVTSLLVAVGSSLNALTSILIGLLVGAALPHMVVGRMGKKRIARFISLFPEAIDLMVRALRSGLPISEAIINASHEIADPVGAEFRTVEAGMRLGRELDTLLWDIAKRIDAPEYKFFIIALNVQRETGGNLAETLANLADMLRRRRTMRQKARAMASEARASTMILGSLPFLVTGVLMMTSPTYILTLFRDPRGIMLCAIALGMLGTGIGIMVKMAKFDI
jgi:tight adherence protein B